MWRPIRRVPSGDAPSSSASLTSPARSKRSGGVLLVLVRLEPVRSAEPPSISGRAAVKASSASCEALREATVSALAWAATAASTVTCAKLRGSSPFMRRLNSAASSGMGGAVGGEALVPFGLRASPLARASQSRYTSGGTVKGSCGQPMASRVSLTSSSPSASPWALAVLARFGLPLPMCVFATMSVGRSALRLASAMARSIASTSWPSTGPITFQP